ATSRWAYGFYRDVVVFDTTFNTNRYDLTFAPMLGFKKAMPGGEPKTINTDQDAAMTRAISIAFPTTFHRLCIWHITSKFSVKLP
ncbi:PREDICTED: FAR1-RELATED SEQUENCE, partial [Prunus dulcis]